MSDHILFLSFRSIHFYISIFDIDIYLNLYLFYELIVDSKKEKRLIDWKVCVSLDSPRDFQRMKSKIRDVTVDVRRQSSEIVDEVKLYTPQIKFDSLSLSLFASICIHHNYPVLLQINID
jgi:hypothetical protein